MGFLKFLTGKLSQMPKEIVNGQVYLAKNTKGLYVDVGTERLRLNPQANWDEKDASNPAFIANKPTLGTAAAYDIETGEELSNHETIPTTKLVNQAFGDVKSQVESIKYVYGSPQVAHAIAEMVDTSIVYVYMAPPISADDPTPNVETGMQQGYWYYYDGESWQEGGPYNSTAIYTDTTLRVSGAPADAAITGIYVQDFSDSLEKMNNTLNLKADTFEVGEDGYLYVYGNGVRIGDPLGPFAGGGSGGGGGGSGGGSEQTNNATINAHSTTGWTTKSIPATEETCNISFEWESLEDELPTGDGSVTVYINGRSRIIRGISQGEVTINVARYLNKGANGVRVVISDVYNNQWTINYTVIQVSLAVTSSFKVSSPYMGSFSFPYKITGNVDAIFHCAVDGTELETDSIDAKLADGNASLSKVIPAQTHGSHTIEAWCVAEIDGAIIESTHIRYEFMARQAGNSKPIIISNYNAEEIDQYTNIVIEYYVYDPATIDKVKVDYYINDEYLNSSEEDRTISKFQYRAVDSGALKIEISCGEGDNKESKVFNINVKATDKAIGAITQDLELYLSASSRSNGEENPATWQYNNISAQMTGFNFVSDGWMLDENNDSCLRISGDARVTIPFKIFATNFVDQYGKTIEFEFATRYIRDYDATIIDCIDYVGDNVEEWRGLKVTAQTATLKSLQTTVSYQFKEDEHVRVTFVVEPKIGIEGRPSHNLVYIYINGVMSSVVQYTYNPSGTSDVFSQATPTNIVIGSNYCTTDIYNIRVYNNALTRQEVLKNWISDTQDVGLMLDRYDRNNIFDENGNISISMLPKTLPYMIVNTEGTRLPTFKGDKQTLTGEYVDPNDSTKSYSFEGAQWDVQGTSSQYYARKNFKVKYKKGVNCNGATGVVYQMKDDGMPASVYCFKKDVASSEGANNVELVRLYDLAVRNFYTTPAQLQDPKVRQGIDGYPMIMFENNGSTTKFIGKYNHNFDKGAENVFGFVEGDESWEVLNNTSLRVTFEDDDFTTDTWKQDFEARYPDEEPKYADKTQLEEFVKWVKSTDTKDADENRALPNPVTYTYSWTEWVERTKTYTDGEGGTGIVLEPVTHTEQRTYNYDTVEYRKQKFKHELGNYVELQSCMFYYLFTELFLMVDSRAKNMFPSFMGSPISQS